MLYLESHIKIRQRIRAFNIRLYEFESVYKLFGHFVLYINKMIQILQPLIILKVKFIVWEISICFVTILQR